MSSPLACTVCHRPIAQCVCREADARLKSVYFDPAATMLMAKWCRRCDKHYARCQCETPEFYIVSAGKDITDQVRGGLPNLLGELVVPDLEHR